MNSKSVSHFFILCFFLAVSSFLCLFASGSLDSEDGWLYASVARNMYYHHQIAAAPDEYPDLNVHMNAEKGADGIWRAPGSLGYSVSLLPAVFLSDLVHQYYKIPPPQHFPLEHDWSFHLFASFTNCFIGGYLAAILLLYAVNIGYSHKKAVVFSLLTLGTTSLLPLTKFSFAHMLFISCFMTVLYQIKRFSKTQQVIHLVFALAALLITAISYNETFLLLLAPITIFLLIHQTPVQRRVTVLTGFLGMILFFLVSQVRNKIFSYVLFTLQASPKILFEGVWGYVFSSGKSIFLYTPQLMLLPIFWHKTSKKVSAELVTAAVLTASYLFVLGSASLTKTDYFQPIWHGGMSWGPRYIAVLIPLWMVVVFQIIETVKKWQKYFLVVPLFLLGAWVQIVGVSTSYLLQYIDLPYHVFVNKTEVLVYDYASFIPRYTPLFTLSKQFAKLVFSLPETVKHGEYQVRLLDGFDPPYKTAAGTFRGFRKAGFIVFTSPKNTVTEQKKIDISLLLANVPDVNTASESAEIHIKANGVEQTHLPLQPNQEKIVHFQFIVDTSRQNQQLEFRVTHLKPLAAPEVIYIKKMDINGSLVNLGSIDYPDMSKLGLATTPLPYMYSGVEVTDPWIFWQIRARINERTLDFWWIKNLYFWDRPKNMIWLLFGVNVAATVVTTSLVTLQLKNSTKRSK